MSVIFETLLALLAGAGALAIGWVLFGRMLFPAHTPQDCSSNVFAVIRAEGSAADLQHTANSLIWLNQSGLSAFQIVIADAGLNDEGHRAASLLTGHAARVSVCPLSALGDWIAGTNR